MIDIIKGDAPQWGHPSYFHLKISSPPLIENWDPYYQKSY